MSIDVREAMDNYPVVEERMFKSRKPNCEDAWRRVMLLDDSLNEIQRVVNDVHIGDTEESWKIAYEMLYTAFKNAIAEEKHIAMKL